QGLPRTRADLPLPAVARLAVLAALLLPCDRRQDAPLRLRRLPRGGAGRASRQDRQQGHRGDPAGDADPPPSREPLALAEVPPPAAAEARTRDPDPYLAPGLRHLD